MYFFYQRIFSLHSAKYFNSSFWMSPQRIRIESWCLKGVHVFLYNLLRKPFRSNWYWCFLRLIDDGFDRLNKIKPPLNCCKKRGQRFVQFPMDRYLIKYSLALENIPHKCSFMLLLLGGSNNGRLHSNTILYLVSHLDSLSWWNGTNDKLTKYGSLIKLYKWECCYKIIVGYWCTLI